MTSAQRGEDDRDLNELFDQIVSPLRDEMDWSMAPLDPPTVLEQDSPIAANDPAQERIRRRLERAQEFAEFNAQKAAAEAEYLAEDGDFVPPDPGPLPRLRRSTWVALALIIAGLVLFIAPTLLPAPQDITVVLAIAMIVGGGIWLVTKLRPGDVDDGDNGARL